MTFLVEVTAEAEKDLTSISHWLISRHAGHAGVRWSQALEEAIATLSQFPKRCALAPENRIFPFEVRHLFYGHKPHIYRILFTIETNTVYVLHVRHGRRQPVIAESD